MFANGWDMESLKKVDAFSSLINSMGETELKALSTKDAITQMTTSIIEVPEKTSGSFDKIASNFKSILSGTLTSMAVSAAIGLAVKGIEVFWTEVINAE